VLFAPGTISTGDDEAHATFSPDGQRLYYLKDAPDFSHWTVVTVEWTGDGFGQPEVASFSGQYGDGDVSFAPDGKTVYFVSTRPANPGAPAKADTDLFRMRIREGGAFSEPERIDELSSDHSEWYPNATADGWLYFGSERREGNLGRDGTSDLWRARLARTRFGAPENLGPTINTPGNEIEPWISADGRLLIFSSSGRPDTRGSYDLYVSHRCGDTWSEPKNLGAEVNSPGWEFGGRPTPDLRYLFFTSNRNTAFPPDHRLSYRELTARTRAPGNGLRDIYRVEMASLDLRSPCP
jgi:WD40-like Beta Propeller Repeat